MDLSGEWRAQAADEGLRRAFPRPDLDDSAWPTLTVPGHWRSSAPFAEHDGPLLYRRSFDAPSPLPDRRVWLVLDGLFYLGDVWLDGAYVGDTEGYFFPHSFEVTDGLRARTEHVLGVEVTCSRPADRRAKRNLTGVFQHWDCLDPDWNPGGIWRPVRLEETGSVRITRLRTLCREANAERAVIAFRACLDAADAGAVTLRTVVGGIDHVAEQPLAAGRNEVEWTVTVPNPDLWWPWALGPQALVDVAVDVLDRSGVSDRRALRTGLREVRLRKWTFEVNGERLFAKGSNQGPTRMALAEATADDFDGDVRLAREAGLDLLRVHAHVSRPELYDAADEAGILLWQDMPLQWGYARSVRRQAVRQAREAVDLLGHHPSVAVWCGHNEPVRMDPPAGHEGPSVGDIAHLIGGWELPTWNKTVLDLRIRRALESADRTRPVIPHSGIPPHPGSGGTDAHLYFGWYHGKERDLPTFLAAFPRMARFVSEFGAQAVPDTAEFMEPDRWPSLDWERLAERHNLQHYVFDRHVPPGEFASFKDWQEATQDYQARVIRFHIETLRRLKYRPAGGFCQFAFADGHPGVTWCVLDHERVPKKGFDALRAACAPVIVVADRLAERYRPGEAIALDVHVVSDLRHPISGRVQARLGWTGGSHTWTWEGDVGKDDCVRVGTVQAIVAHAPGPLTLDVELSGDVNATNRYESVIA